MPKKKHQLELVTLPAENLRQPSEKVKFPLPAGFQRTIDEMMRVCRKHNGVGIAAPQVGLNIRAIVINLEDMGMPPFPLLNPEITKFSREKEDLEEGCLSIPGKFAKVKRSVKVDVKAHSLDGKVLEFKAEGFFARVLQHEVDHVNGILFVDHLDKKTREELVKEFYQ